MRKITRDQLKAWEYMSVKVLVESGALLPMRLKSNRKDWKTMPINVLANRLTK